MLITPGMAISVYLIPVWIAVLGVGYLFSQKSRKAMKPTKPPPRYLLLRVPRVVTSLTLSSYSVFIHIAALILQRIYSFASK